ncbi:peptidoglycan DD-metalloendopeptidase family protein [Myxococcota bacterium]|nr:peptidoglycan DD-metalloendopeptidase family protein [Myxococcota bacterium]
MSAPRLRPGALPALALAALLLRAAPAPAQAPVDVGWAGDLEASRLDERNVLDQLNALDRELQAVRDQREGIQERLLALEESARRNEDTAASAEALLAARRPEVKARLRALYRLHRRGLARIVFGAEDPAELRRRSVYMLAILKADLARMKQYADAMANRSTAKQALEKDLMAMTALRAELQLREAEIREQRARRMSTLDEIRSRRGLASSAMTQYGQIGRSLDQRLGLGGDAEAIQAQVRVINPEGSFRESFGRLPWPTTGQLVRRFGPYMDPSTGEEFDSIGLQISAEYGTPFRAVFDGSVRLADFVPGYGQTVVIEHGPYSTVYAHANGLKVRTGDSVRAGDVLGMVGNSGLTDGRGYVLGFELRYNGSPQDPLPWLAPR